MVSCPFLDAKTICTFPNDFSGGQAAQNSVRQPEAAGVESNFSRQCLFAPNEMSSCGYELLIQLNALLRVPKPLDLSKSRQELSSGGCHRAAQQAVNRVTSPVARETVVVYGMYSGKHLIIAVDGDKKLSTAARKDQVLYELPLGLITLSTKLWTAHVYIVMAGRRAGFRKVSGLKKKGVLKGQVSVGDVASIFTPVSRLEGPGDQFGRLIRGCWSVKRSARAEMVSLQPLPDWSGGK
ncbi:hypothetical protein RRG08_058470 [Elysia crispata]|uniref:Uncharacterized protein n=1 Tax=Elysia crispata TaxID=231223 RepID=A0AAE1CT53_9GAST|nr:hypothetical protein RRG08_058470 [Elysia crispata]